MIRLTFPATNHTLQDQILDEEEQTDEKEEVSFLPLISCAFMFVGIFHRILLTKVYRKLKEGKERDKFLAEASTDILYSAVPIHFGKSYGSFSSPWNEGLEKFDV